MNTGPVAGSSASSVEFSPPRGFVPPEGTQEGKPFDLVCTFEPVAGGKLRLTRLGDASMSEASSAPEAKPDYSQYHQSMMGEMEGGEES